MLVQASTQELNPLFDARAIAKAYEDDPASAAAEYGAQFRSDVESFVSPEAIDACVMRGRREISPIPGCEYLAFVDPSGGSGADSFTLAIGRRWVRDARPIAVVDCLRESKLPLSPESIVGEYAALLKTYRVTSVTGDRYAGEWPRDAFKRHGITYDVSPKPKSDLYRDALAILNSTRVELLDEPRLLAQLAALERRTARGGRDSIDHPPGGHDDVANAVCGFAVIAAAERPDSSLVWDVGPPLTAEERKERNHLVMMRRYAEGDYPHW